MTAAGKINASKVQIGDRVVIRVWDITNEADRAGLEWMGSEHGVGPSKTKTAAAGTNVVVSTVIGKDKCINRRGYMIETGVGTFYAEPIETMWVAQEDAAGIKRAHVEALAEDKARTAAECLAPEEFTTEERDAIAADYRTSGALDDAHAEALETEHMMAPTEVRGPSKSMAPALIGQTLRPLLETGVRMARSIPEGRRRHGMTKALRDALRHAHKLELAGI